MNPSKIEKLDSLDSRVPDWMPFPLKKRGCPFCEEYSDPLFLRPDNLPVSQCLQCRCFYVSVSLDAGALKAFYDRYWTDTCPRPLTDEMASYLKATAGKRAAADHCLLKLGGLSGTWKNRKTLDVGCGFGEKSTMMSALGALVIGLDIADDAVNFMNEKLKIEAYHTVIEEFEGSKDFFDIVTMFEFVEHPLDPLRSLEVAVDKMKPGGLLAIVTPNGTAGDKGMFPVHDEWIGFQVDLEHMQYLHAETIDYLAHKLRCRIVHLEQLGFRAIEDISGPAKGVPTTGSQKFRRCVKSIPGVRSIVYALRDLQRRWHAAGIPSHDAGIYHLFAVLQKIE